MWVIEYLREKVFGQLGHNMKIIVASKIDCSDTIFEGSDSKNK